MMTADDTSETLLAAVRRQAYRYLRKPFAPSAIVEVVNEAAAPTAALSIEVVSARPEWVELVAPCTLEMADRIQSFVMQLEANLSEAVREAVAQAFRELLTNAIEWGGKLDPERKVRIACVRTPADAALPHRRSRRGVRHRQTATCGHHEPGRRSDATSVGSRATGTPPWRLWAGDDALAGGRSDLQRGAQRGIAHQVTWTTERTGSKIRGLHSSSLVSEGSDHAHETAVSIRRALAKSQRLASCGGRSWARECG